MYSQDRFFTFTGHLLPESSQVVEARQHELDKLHAEILFKREDTSLTNKVATKRATSSPNNRRRGFTQNSEERLVDGETFNRLWSGQWEGSYASQSEADLALCSKLSFWNGGDQPRMDHLFRRSGLFRDKWDERHFSNGQTYGESTLAKAIVGCRDYFHASSSTIVAEMPDDSVNLRSWGKPESKCRSVFASSTLLHFGAMQTADFDFVLPPEMIGTTSRIQTG